MKKIVTALIVVLIVLTPLFAQGTKEDVYPSRPIELTVQWSAGGGSDLVLRALADVFPKYAGQPMVVKNVPGASGVTGTVQFLDTAKPDGYSVMHWSNAHVSKYHMDKDDSINSSMSRHVAQVVESTHYILVRADSKWKTFEDFIADVKAHPGKIKLGNAGMGGGNHLAACLLEQAAGVSFTHVPYKGGGPSVIGLMSGEVDAALCNSPEGYSNVDAGQIRILIAFGSEPLIGYEDVPLAKDKGFPIELRQWRGLAVPLGTPEAIVDRLDDIIKQCVEDPEYIEKCRKIGVTPVYRDTEAYNKFILSEEERFKNLMIERKLGNRY